MAQVTKWYKFEAAHRLPNHDGKCRRLHGHSYKFAVRFDGHIETDVDHPKEGMVVDYNNIDWIVDPIVEHLDHSYLNDDVTGLGIPTAENIACYIFNLVDQATFKATLRLVIVKETESTEARVSERDVIRWKQNSQS